MLFFLYLFNCTVSSFWTIFYLILHFGEFIKSSSIVRCIILIDVDDWYEQIYNPLTSFTLHTTHLQL